MVARPLRLAGSGLAGSGRASISSEGLALVVICIYVHILCLCLNSVYNMFTYIGQKQIIVTIKNVLKIYLKKKMIHKH